MIINADMVAVITGTAALRLSIKNSNPCIGVTLFIIPNLVTLEPSLAALPKAIAEGLRPKPSDNHIQLYLASICLNPFV